MMRTLREQNVGIVFISHKLNEVMQICDRYVVLRDGEIAGEGNIDEVHTGDLARMMVGHEIRVISLQREKEDREEALRVEALNDGHNFHNISFSVRKGEVLGITGLLGMVAASCSSRFSELGLLIGGSVFTWRTDKNCKHDRCR